MVFQGGSLSKGWSLKVMVFKGGGSFKGVVFKGSGLPRGGLLRDGLSRSGLSSGRPFKGVVF